ncbi:MAG TPA: GntR family transcriptional regulator [Chloroflexota bacterium]|nr:GntR family transcriptional regulator [Chloroflexota bacterium]
MTVDVMPQTGLGLDATTVINREVPIPYYYQLEGLLRQHILQGSWVAGQRVPSEKQLCEFYAVSRTTVRQAVSNLVGDGLLYHVKGKGTFVRKRME